MPEKTLKGKGQFLFTGIDDLKEEKKVLATES